METRDRRETLAWIEIEIVNDLRSMLLLEFSKGRRQRLLHRDGTERLRTFCLL